MKDRYFSDIAEEIKEHKELEHNPEIFELGGNIDGDEDDEKLQLPYQSASNVCTSMDTVVPRSMAIEQRKFNERLKAAIAEMGMSVEQYVAKKLHYRSVDELCFQDETDKAGNKIVRFAAEQIDAIATAIWNYESGDNGIIIADQTGSGKGRSAAGILRYAILDLKKVPFFFTEKKHLINDIYRDLIAIGFDAGVPYKFRETVVIEKSDFTDEEILKIIIQDIKDRDDLRIDFALEEGFNLEWIKRSLDESHPRYDEIEEIKAEIVEAYRQEFLENGYEKEIYKLNPNYKEDVVSALRRGKMLVQPFVPNLIDIKDISGNIIYEAPTKKEVDLIYKTNSNLSDKDLTEQLMLPSKFKLFAMPYSQIGTGFETAHGKVRLKNKIVLFQKYANESVVVLDESHNASGLIKGELTNTGKIIFDMVKLSKLTTYLSATYAKRAENMPLYALKTSVKESGLSDKEIINTFMEGGNSLQEAVSAELARNGQLLRREKIIQGSSEYYYENEGTETGDNQIAKLDRVALLYKMVLDFSDNVRSAIREYKSKLQTQEEKDAIKPARGVNALAFQLFNFMLLGLKIRQTSEFTIKNLQSGKKTVVAVASTMESALDNLSKTFMSNSDMDSYKVGDRIKNDFSLYIAYLLNYTMRYNHVDIKVDSEGNEEEVKQTIYVLDSKDELSTFIKDRVLDGYKVMLAKILGSDTGIPIAPLDTIEKNIKDAGFSVSEITGRQRKIVFDSDTTYGTITKRDIKKTDIIVRDFNENETDCLLINQSGAVGISMQALPNEKANIVYEPTIENGIVTENAPTTLENKREVKKRAMVITQMELDINKEVQKLGRINRMGQVYLPEYTYIISAIPSEARLTALMEKKLRSLSANVSSNQQQSAYLFTADDFFSDIAVAPFNETMIEVGMRGVEVSTGSQIQEFTKTLYFKEYQLQKDFYDTFSKKLTQEVQTLTEQGLYTGKMTHKDYHAETIIQYPFYIGDNNAKTSFGRHSVIEKCSVKMYRERNTEKKIAGIINDRLVLKTDQEGKEDRFFNNNIPAFQKAANERLDTFERQKRKAIEAVIESIKKDLEGSKTDLQTWKDKTKAFGELEAAITLESELKKASDSLETVKENMVVAMGDGKYDEIKTLTEELRSTTELRDSLKEKLKPFEELLKTKSELKQITRGISSIENDIERHEKRISRLDEEMVDFVKLIHHGKKYLSKIGNVMQLDVYDQIVKYDEDSVDNRVVEYTPNKIYSNLVVVSGISFPSSYHDLTPGKFEIDVCGVSEKFTYNLYQLEKNDGQPHQVLTIINHEYKNMWNEHAGKSDNSYKEDRYIIIGSLLKTFSLGKANEIAGQIIKYNTSENKTRIGIEVQDNEDEKSGRKSVYKVLEERYGGETALQRPIYYDGNPENVTRFMEDYIFFYMFGETYEKLEKETSPEDGTFQPISMPRDFIFQISSSQTNAFVVITVDEEHRIEAQEISKTYNNKIKKTQGKIDKEAILKGLRIAIVSDNISAADFFAFYYSKATGAEINAENYEVAGKTKNFPNAYLHRSKQIDRLRFNGGLQFKTFFPTNIIAMQNYIYNGVPYNAKLKMDFAGFKKLIEYLTKKRTKPTFATSSSYFERHRGDYVFEQFLDDVEPQKTMTPASAVVFNESVESEMNALIDELVVILSA